MTITATQKSARMTGVGASEVAAVLGLDPYRSAYDVWAEKTGKLEAEKVDSEAASLGNELEPLLLKRAAGLLGKPVVPAPERFEAPNGVMFAHLDGMVGHALSGSDIVEAKSSMLEGDWGEPGTHLVPERVAIQVQAQMFCADSSVAHVIFASTKFGLRGFRPELYRVERSLVLIDAIEEGVCNFWLRHVQKDIPPPQSLPTEEVYKRFRRTVGKTVTIADSLVRAYIDANEQAKQAEKAKESTKAALIAALGDAEVGESGIGTVFYKLQQRKGYTVAATEYRQLRIGGVK